MADPVPAPSPRPNRRGRDAPSIPDHEVFRQIGFGSFGEVWLARAVTGVFRAVKVIHREDFENERDFEREFEAIKRYEPISRQHPNLVQVLQVGRDDPAGIYYYIMEIADDLENGPEFEHEEYSQHTLRAEMIHRERIDLAKCAEEGAQIAEALQFLHEKDLIHRDVKLSNIIYVNGICKLADIGLVAALGDRSFVGTEGYVPPEGAGSPSADIFSLGMVIYELCTDKDRLDFPDVPSDFRERSDALLWRRINEAICTACARRPEKRFTTAEDMAHALRGEPVSTKKRWPIYAGIAAAVLILALILIFRPIPEPEGFELTTEPAGADVYAGADYLGKTPLVLEDRPEEGVSYEFRLRGFRNEVIEYAGAADNRAALHIELEDSKFPQPGSEWRNSLGLVFKPIASGHRLEFPVHADQFMEFARDENRVFEGEVVLQKRENRNWPIPITSLREARAFALWLQERDVAEGFIGPDYTYRAAVDTREGLEWPNRRIQIGRTTVLISPFTILVEKQRYGSLQIVSDPPGAEIYRRNGEYVGTTPHEMGRVKTGNLNFEIRMDGYKTAYLEGTVEANGLLELRTELAEGQAVEWGKPWQNSLGMDFMPVMDILVSAWETRVQDYLEYCNETGARLPAAQSTGAQAFHPVHGVSREDAEDFCRWLTRHERATGWITERHEYRLPTDEEWSRAAGLPLERGTTPATRNGLIDGVYPWGYSWPPQPGSGNFADESLQRFFDATEGSIGGSFVQGPEFIEGYDDSFHGLAWVQELRPNQYGLYHVSGNVWEWVIDNYFGGGGGPEHAGTIRGGSWQTYERRELLSSYRRSLAASERVPGVGFRCVLGRAEGP